MTMFPVPVSAAAAPAHQGLSAEDVRRVQKLLDRSVSASTRAAYSSAWLSFEKWADGRAVMALPATPALVAGYLSHLAEERKVSVATVRLHRAALAAVHRATGHEDPTDNEGVRRILQGISRTHGKAQKQAKPLTAEALAAVKATAGLRRQLGQGEKGRESAQRASWRALVDVALLSILRDGLLRRSEAAALTWGGLEFREDRSALLQVRRSKTDPGAEGVVLYIGQEAAAALWAIRPAAELLDLKSSVFGLSPRQLSRRVKAAARAAGLGDGFTGHSGRVGMAQDLVKNGVELPALMTAGRWKSSTMPARYTERQSADRGAVARYYREGRG